MRRVVLLLPPTVLCLLVTVLPAADPPQTGSPNLPEEGIEALIRQLGDPNFEVRQKATQRLQDTPDARPALRRALKSADPEVARRAESILEELHRRGEKKALARMEQLAKDGAVDQAIELFVRRQSWADEEAAWQVMTGLADRLIDLSEKDYGEPPIPERKPALPAGDYRRYREQAKPTLLPFEPNGTTRIVGITSRGEKPVLARAEEIEAGQCCGDLLVSTGALRAGTDKKTRPFWLVDSVVFAGGPVDVGKAINSVIVCDGEFYADSASNCLIVARGNVRCSSSIRNSRFVSSGKVFQIKASNGQTESVEEKESRLLKFVKWFDPASVGVVVEAAEGGVRVKEAAEGKAFAKAGLRSGDLVTRLNDTPTTSPDVFRRLLRARLAEEDEMVFQVRRDLKTLDITVQPPN